MAFGGLVIAGTLLFSDLERQKQNMLPLLLLIFIAIVASVIGLSVWYDRGRWAFWVMGAVAIVLLIACGIILGGEFLRELKRRFHIK